MMTSGLRMSRSNHDRHNHPGKGFAVDLRQHDLRDLPLPYASDSFDHVISVAVLNSFGDCGPLFKEISRIIKAPGLEESSYLT